MLEREAVQNAIWSNIRLNWYGHDHAALDVESVSKATDVILSLASPALRGLVDAVERFLNDYDDGDRADAGVNPLMEAHVRDFRAALSTPTAPAVAEGEAIALLREVFDLPKVLARLPDDLYDRIDAILAAAPPAKGAGE